MPLALLSFCLLLVLAGAGCKKEQAETPTVATPAANTEQQQKKVPAPGEIPFEYPSQSVTTAKAGEYVLYVPRPWIDRAFEDKSNAMFIYYAAKMKTPGTNESEVTTLPGESMLVPNSLIIPIGTNKKTKKGDIILTWWQTGSGMQRAIVTGGTATEPEVLYLDREFNPADKTEKLEANSFIVMSVADQAGVTVACKEIGEKDYARYQLVNKTTDKYLVLGWAGKMSVQKKADCATLPLMPNVKVGDNVYFPTFGRFELGSVTKIDPAAGRVIITYTFAGQSEEVAVPFGDVTTQFVR